ncbi:MAG: histidine kinase dimerization/phospho-acceptor domain-containing protein [Syntrophales bacterium]
MEAAEVASRAKSLFIGNMSHELRTPLSGVLGMTKVLLNTSITDQQRDYAEKIRKSGEALRYDHGKALRGNRLGPHDQPEPGRAHGRNAPGGERL